MRVHSLILGLFLFSPCLFANVGDDPKPKQAPANIYDESANAPQQIADAVARGKRDNKHVLLQWGANWCHWCHKLHDLFTKDPEVAKELLYDYEVVMVDLGKMDKSSANMQLAAKLGASFEDSGIPYLTVLDTNGKPICQQATGPLEKDGGHDPAKVIAFLKEHAPAPLDAEQVLANAQAKAKAEQKVVFAHFGAPWCGWCRKLDAWLDSPEVAKTFGAGAVEVKIDIERMTHGAAIMARYRTEKSDGIPWFVFLGADGTAIATSDGPKGNLGFPSTPEEIATFGELLGKAKFDEDSTKALTASLRAASAPRAASTPKKEN